MTELRRSDRPRHDEHPVHDLRPLRRASSSVDQMEHEQIFPRAGWVEHDADGDLEQHPRGDRRRARPRPNLNAGDIAAVGITNQRETAVVWDKNTGEPVYNAIVWQDTRTAEDLSTSSARSAAAPTATRPRSACRWRRTSPGPKVRWILDNVDGAREQGRGRRPAVRQHRHLGAVEPHRRCRTAACTSPT